MGSGSTMLGIAFAAYEAELDGFVRWIVGDESTPESEQADVVEYRLLIHYGGRDGVDGIESRSLGVVNEDFARRKAAEMRRDRARSVVVEARPLLRGRWSRVCEVGQEPARPVTGLGLTSER